MSKHRHKDKRPFATVEDPVCPCCARRDKLFEDPELDAMGMTGCARCSIQFWFEEIEEGESDSNDGETDEKSAEASAAVFIDAWRENGKRTCGQTHPVPGRMVELTDE